eukprot:TRINITY_DN4410_c0_g1_i1.p1 TRINITY_DN4410_c0_g1~~TRINITY_DN4410_c0_g1_i1.p1  ORF type:complete len:352 (+),score=111.09 TRINITY_DN4410_c0_g1_i1:75-1130(+)
MPRKKKAAGKAVRNAKNAKQRDKIVKDLTFGMKNKKKSKKVQKYVSQLQSQAANQNRKRAPKQKTKKELKAEREAEYNAIFKPVITQKMQKGVDPKSILCEFFKKGRCSKGNRCKFSHDMTQQRKVAKIDVYTDTRESEETMEDWDENKLREVVQKKMQKRKVQYDIVCKYFIEAIQNKKYGFFWECPNGGDDCKYRHALPPGFVLEEKKKPEEEEDKQTIEEKVDEERSKLRGGTPLTLETFLAWKARKLEEKEKKMKKREDDAKSGKVALTGREVFTFNPQLAGDDDIDASDDKDLYKKEEDIEQAEREEKLAAEKEAKAKEELAVDSSLFDGADLEDLEDLDELDLDD